MDNAEKSNRLISAAAALLNAAPNQELNIVVLNKCLFYLDLVALRDGGSTITKNAFIALENGPVVAKYPKRLVKEMDNRGIATEIQGWSGSKPLKLIEQQVLPDYLEPYKKQIIQIANHFSCSSQASDFSHLNIGWQSSWEKCKEEKRPAPINMLVAMQQVLEDDPWMHEPLSEGESLAIVGPADADESEIW